MKPDLEAALAASQSDGSAIEIDATTGQWRVAPRGQPWREPERQEEVRRTPMSDLERIFDAVFGTRP